MFGAWTVTRNKALQIHTYAAPEEGWAANSHIVELPSQLLVVDAQYRLSLARKVARYAGALNKPIGRLYVTHYHPDHLLGGAAFDAPLYALANVAAKIAAVGDRIAGEEREKIGVDAPDRVRRADRLVEPGEEVIDGVRIVHAAVRGGETEDALTLAVPEAGAIIVQDLVYNHAHPFLGERRFESWKQALREHHAQPFDIVLPGHGAPSGRDLYVGMTEYLDFAQAALTASTSAEMFKRRLLERFPDYGAREVLSHQLRFLFG